MKTFFLLIFSLFSSSSFSQSDTIVHIHKARMLSASAIKFRLNVNSQDLEMKNAGVLKLPLKGDSLHIELLNKGLKKARRQVHIPLKNENFILIDVQSGKAFRSLRDSVIIQQVCKECFENVLAESSRQRR